MWSWPSSAVRSMKLPLECGGSGWSGRRERQESRSWPPSASSVVKLPSECGEALFRDLPNPRMWWERGLIHCRSGPRIDYGLLDTPSIWYFTERSFPRLGRDTGIHHIRGAASPHSRPTSTIYHTRGSPLARNRKGESRVWRKYGAKLYIAHSRGFVPLR